MVSHGLVPLSQVKKMLKKCAPGHIWEVTDHWYQVTYRAKFFKNLPKKDEIERPYVRKLVQHLEIESACAQKYIPSLT